VRLAALLLVGALCVALVGGCGSADRAVGSAEATCERFEARLAGAHSTLLSGLATTAGAAAAELKAAGSDTRPWSQMPPRTVIATCMYTTLPVRPHQQPDDLFVDSAGRTSPVPAADQVPAEVNGP
jgi:hypothetical protein